MAKVNYTTEQETELRDFYIARRGENASNETVLAEINEKFSRATKSARAKLVSMKVYVADEKPAARPKDDGPTKKELQASVASFGVNLDGSDNASKAFFVNLITFLADNGIEQAVTETE